MFNLLNKIFNIYLAGGLAVLGLLSGIRAVYKGYSDSWKVFAVAGIFGMWTYSNRMNEANSYRNSDENIEISLVRNYLKSLEPGKEDVSQVLNKIRSITKEVSEPRFRNTGEEFVLIEIYIRKKPFLFKAKEGKFHEPT